MGREATPYYIYGGTVVREYPLQLGTQMIRLISHPRTPAPPTKPPKTRQKSRKIDENQKKNAINEKKTKKNLRVLRKCSIFAANLVCLGTKMPFRINEMTS